MYIPIAFMGSCLAGARAISQAFLSLRVSISSVVGGLRVVVDLLDLEGLVVVEEVKPGGSGKVVLGRVGGVELRSRTHCGGGGGVAMSRSRNLGVQGVVMGKIDWRLTGSQPDVCQQSRNSTLKID